MSNFSNGERLLNEAKRVFKEVENAYKEKAWNMVIRRAQEVVELSLKGLLKMMCIDYPKEHDVGKVLGVAVEKRELKIPKRKLRKIEEISAYLAQMRSPAFYFEKEYTQKQAEKAKREALEVLEFAGFISQKLEGR